MALLKVKNHQWGWNDSAPHHYKYIDYATSEKAEKRKLSVCLLGLLLSANPFDQPKAVDFPSEWKTLGEVDWLKQQKPGCSTRYSKKTQAIGFTGKMKKYGAITVICLCSITSASASGTREVLHRLLSLCSFLF